ncbi:MAG: molybdopterin-dependent oxidoreductase [Acidimicrobiales bacterium]
MTTASPTTSTGANRTAIRTCPLCEATCGLEITVGPGEQVVRIRGDRDDVFSHGFICPKGSTLKQLHEDPDRLRRPLVRKNGVHVEVSWDEAWEAVAAGLSGVIDRHGRDALAVYGGNPGAHNLGSMLYNSVVYRSMGSHNKFSASTVDQIPKHVAGGYMFGTAQSIPVPDLDHTDYLVLLGANPYESNGSLCTAPDFPGRIEAIRARGGKVVTIDPRRTKTADNSDQWIDVKPGTDGLLLAAVINVLFAENLVKPEPRLASITDGIDELRAATAALTPESVETATGVAAATIRTLAREIAAAPTAAVYGRIGVNAVEFGTLNAWLIDSINLLTGNLDRRGGAMFTMPATGSATTRGQAGRGKGFSIGRGHSRVSRKPEAMGEYPVAILAEEITTPGEGQVRGFICLSGNPVVSTPHSRQLDAALESLEFMVSVDIYLNETSRHADVVLPAPSALQKEHYDVGLYAYAVRNVANFSERVFPLEDGQPDEWEILVRLGAILQGLPADTDPQVIDDAMLRQSIGAAVATTGSPVHGRDADEIFDLLSVDGRVGPARQIDLMLQTGPYGAGFGANPGGLSLQKLLDNPHGVDLGPLEPRLPEALRTPTGRIDIAPSLFLGEMNRLAEKKADMESAGMLLVGRRDLKSNNSWMHNIRVLTKGALSCTLHVHPDDAAGLGVSTGSVVRVTSRVGSVDVTAEVTDSVRRGVVSLPHGWGHNVPGTRMAVAAEKAGVNSNILTDDRTLDPLSGNASLNAIPVTLQAV